MALAKMIEKNSERLESALNLAKQRANANAALRRKDKEILEDLISEGWMLLEELRRNEEIANDPTIDMAGELVRLKNEIKNRDETLEKERRNLDEITAQLEKLKMDYEELNKRCNGINAENARKGRIIYERKKEIKLLRKVRK